MQAIVRCSDSCCPDRGARRESCDAIERAAVDISGRIPGEGATAPEIKLRIPGDSDFGGPRIVNNGCVSKIRAGIPRYPNSTIRLVAHDKGPTQYWLTRCAFP